ncbi:hypothetical protein ACLMAJ_10880 [Nocardia sp. KC 131]|uniref:hypothetical protein n=1 Tax=Nocardia arseniciresistens TaxID=3392119 RepID=UPI00398F5172
MSDDVVAHMPEGEIASSVRELLTVFHEDTRAKLELAPVDSRPTLHMTDGMVCAVDANGWPEWYDDLDKLEALPARPISVRDTETL